MKDFKAAQDSVLTTTLSLELETDAVAKTALGKAKIIAMNRIDERKSIPIFLPITAAIIFCLNKTSRYCHLYAIIVSSTAKLHNS